jgi:TrmH family RNA methyltransferase
MSNEEALGFLKNNNFKIYGTSLNATQNYNSIQYNSSTALIAGSENNGISDFWIKNSDILIKIPMLGMADSLNVSVSSAICLSEVNRQNKFNR